MIENKTTDNPDYDVLDGFVLYDDTMLFKVQPNQTLFFLQVLFWGFFGFLLPVVTVGLVEITDTYLFIFFILLEMSIIYAGYKWFPKKIRDTYEGIGIDYYTECILHGHFDLDSHKFTPKQSYSLDQISPYLKNRVGPKGVRTYQSLILTCKNRESSVEFDLFSGCYDRNSREILTNRWHTIYSFMVGDLLDVLV